MAALSFSMSRNGLTEDGRTAGTGTVTQDTQAPNAGDVEIRISAAAIAAGISKMELEEMLDRLWRFAYDTTQSSNALR